MVGIDEVGRGCLAGPMLVVAARQKTKLPSGVKDSKKLTKGRRESLYELLILSCDFGEGWVSSQQIDNLGLTAATRLGVKKALVALGVSPDEHLIIDGHINYAPKDFKLTEAIIGADDSVEVVSAASIYAKVVRDRYMSSLADKYPNYGFENHVGYGTAFHLEAIKTLGSIDKLHRLSFGPLKELAR